MGPNFAPHLGLRVGADVGFEEVPAAPIAARRVPVEPTLELVIAFCVWAHDREAFPTTGEVIERFNVAAWDADRWRRALAAEYGVTP